jgi:TatD DNase family protein
MIDFHCHLDLYPDPMSVRDECEKQGLHLLSVTTTPSAWKGTSELAARSKHIRTALGLHPQLAEQRLSELRLFDALLAETEYVGEIGLDGSPEFRPQWQNQIKIFEHILGRCSEVGGRIMSLHSRRASNEVLDRLENFPKSGIAILHWFSGSGSELDRATEQGCWFSVGPAMLSSKKGEGLVARMPRERVLTESDGPFAQMNGQSVMPWGVRDAIGRLSRIWSLPETLVDQQIQDNCHKLCATRFAQAIK